MRAILMSIQSKWVAKILNGEKLIEIRKRFPKDYIGWVYIYCTKQKNRYSIGHMIFYVDECYKHPSKGYKFGDSVELIACEEEYNSNNFLNGKVVARFWCNKVEFIKLINDDPLGTPNYQTDTLDEEDLLNQSCLESDQLYDYLKENNGYALHLSNLEIFDEPKKLSDFYVFDKAYNNCFGWIATEEEKRITIKKAPQSWQYVFVKKTLE